MSESAVSEEESEAEEGSEEGSEADGRRLVPWWAPLPRDGQRWRWGKRHVAARRLALEKWVASDVSRNLGSQLLIGFEEDLWAID